MGVDIFFVISGFLITGLLLREHERAGRVSFVGFYKRRVKRILPAAVIVLVATVAASFFVFNKTRAWNTAWDGVWALFCGANWRQAFLGTDYFAAGGPVSPLQHYWSLAVEEQFYFVWPWLMLGLFALTARLFAGRRANPRFVAGIAMAIITASSLAWSMRETAANPSLAYFSTFSRTWELGLGALLACASPILPRIPAAVRPVLAWIGLAGMVTALFVTEPKVGFPGPGAVLPVAATALVIVAGTGTSEHRFLAPLTNRVSGYLGDISYSLYLWHFPVIVFAAAVAPDATGILHYLALAAIMMLAAVFAYHLAEDPIRKSQWLAGKSKSGTRHIEISDRYKLTALAALMTVTVAVVGAALTPHQVSTTSFAVPAAGKPSASATQTSIYGPEVRAIQTAISAAVQTTEWPDNLTPSMDDAVGNHEAPKGVGECGNNVAPARGECIWGDPLAPKTAMLIGDSVGVAWAPSLIKLYGQGDWKFLMRAQFGCPFVDREATLDSANCARHKEATIAEVKESKPDLLILSNNYPDSGQAGNWAAGEVGILKKAAGAAKTLILASPPHDKDVQRCYKPGSSPTDCVSLANGWYLDLISSERRALSEIGGSYVSTLPIFCSANNVCPSFVGTTPVKLDQVHMTVWYAEKSAPALGELISASLQ